MRWKLQLRQQVAQVFADALVAVAPAPDVGPLHTAISWLKTENTLLKKYWGRVSSSATRPGPRPWPHISSIPTRTASLPASFMSRPCSSSATASTTTAGAAPPTMPSSRASGARSSGSTSTSTPPTTATICISNYRRTLPSTTTTDPTKACAVRRPPRSLPKTHYLNITILLNIPR